MLKTIDGSLASQGQIVQETITTKVVLGAHFKQITFDILQIGRQKLILGKLQLALYNLDIDQTNKEVQMTRCLETYRQYNTKERKAQTGAKKGQINQGLIAERSLLKRGGRGIYNYKKPSNLLEAYSKYKNLFKEKLDTLALLEHKE